jgi:hypothetical protein
LNLANQLVLVCFPIRGRRHDGIFNDVLVCTALCSHNIQLIPEAKPFGLSLYQVNPEKAELIIDKKKGDRHDGSSWGY